MSTPFEKRQLNDAQKQKIEECREAYIALYTFLLTLPDTRNRSVAITNLETSAMWANKGIAFHE